MDILFTSRKLQRLCSDTAKGQKQWGERRNRLIRQRLDQLLAAEDLAVMRNLPGRCHELTGNLRGLFSIDLDGPYRLIFGPEGDPVPRKEDGGIDWTRVQAICIRSVEDTHDK